MPTEPDYTQAALDALTTNAPAQAYSQGYSAGYAAAEIAAAAAVGTELDAVVSGYTPAQEARADALHIATRALNPVPIGSDPTRAAQRLLDVARPLAAWIEHGNTSDQDVSVAGGWVPREMAADLAVQMMSPKTHRMDIEGNLGDITRRPTCTCGWTGSQYTILAEAMAAGTQHVRDAQT